ncbi:uncharacterized protein K02A2.6-like [Octopus sinensis]|uniref:Uncharacterized protein K02A2.6-like n=1 Tax=Octopus sinensis TaxID=2607531 RepID=A0A6P7SNB5_9MOLL|nr:uncharacterized protein K02A2.6-like [Octopus sinensis]
MELDKRMSEIIRGIKKRLTSELSLTHFDPNLKIIVASDASEYGPINYSHYIIVVDSYSKWPEVCKCSRSTTSVTIDFLEELFTCYGVPDTIVSDNDTQFMAKEFERFCKSVQMNHVLTPPYHPRSNGLAERFIDTFKRALRKTRQEILEDTNMTKFLQVYRITPNPNAESGRSPTDLMFSRKNCSIFDKWLPSRKQKIENMGRKTNFFNTGDKVYFKIYSNGKQDWEEGNITGRLGNVMYMVKGPKYEHRRHLNQSKKRHTKNQGRQEEPMDLWYDLFQVPEPQAKAEPTCRLNKKRKPTEMMEINAKRKRYASFSLKK